MEIPARYMADLSPEFREALKDYTMAAWAIRKLLQELAVTTGALDLETQGIAFGIYDEARKKLEDEFGV